MGFKHSEIIKEENAAQIVAELVAAKLILIENQQVGTAGTTELFCKPVKKFHFVVISDSAFNVACAHADEINKITSQTK